MDAVDQREIEPFVEMEMNIGRASLSEARDIWRVTRIAYAPYRGKIKPTFGALRVSVGAIRHQIRTGSRVYIVARHEGKVVGTLRYRRCRRYLGLSRLAVLPGYQGQ